MDTAVVSKIYSEVFLNIKRSNIDLFLCGGASTKDYKTYRDQLRERLQKYNYLSIFYPEDLFMELLSRKKYNLLELENFLAENSDLIMIVCESPGSFVELGAFTSNPNTLKKVIVCIQKKYKNDKSFIMLGPVRYIQSQEKKSVIYYNSDLADLENSARGCLKSKYLLYRKNVKDINLITGQFFFVLLLLYFYNSIKPAELADAVKYIYNKKSEDEKQFDILYTAAIKRLYKEGMLIREDSDYKLTKKGYDSAKSLLNDVMVDKRDRLINGIRLNILSAQYR